MSDALSASLDLLRAAGFSAVDVPVLLPMEDFVRISGEEFRRRIFVTTDAAGTDWCLRPEFTIPVCRKGLSAAPAGGRWSYSGRIFRNGRSGESHEVWQIGAEIVGAHDAAAADAEALRLALDVCRRHGLTAPAVTVGDVALFSALLDALEVPPAWKRRLTALFGDPARVIETLDTMAERRSGYRAFPAMARSWPRCRSSRPSGWANSSPTSSPSPACRRWVAGRPPRSPSVWWSRRCWRPRKLIPEAHAAAIRDLLAIETPLGDAADVLSALSARVGRPRRFEAAVADFAARAAAIGADGRRLPSPPPSGASSAITTASSSTSTIPRAPPRVRLPAAGATTG